MKKNKFDLDLFDEGNHDKFELLIDNYESCVKRHVQHFNCKPSINELISLIESKSNFTSNSEIERDRNLFTTVIEEYINIKVEGYREKLLPEKSIRKKMERYKNIYNTFFLYEQHFVNKRITVIALSEKATWVKLLKFLLFEKPNNALDIGELPNHELNESLPSIFDKNFGISNSTIEKWIGDIRTILNASTNNPNIELKLLSIKKSIKEAMEHWDIKTYRNLEAVIRKPEYDLLKSFKFEEALKMDVLKNGKKVSKETLIKTKDMFIAMTILGCRFGDLINFSQENMIKSSQIALKTQNENVSNVNKRFLQLFRKYNGVFKLSNQKFNDYIKLVFNQFYDLYQSELNFSNDDLTYVEESHRGRYRSVKILKKPDKIGAHSARRSFATMCVLDNNMDEEEVMEFTGHKSIQEFRKYINVKITDSKRKDIANFLE